MCLKWFLYTYYLSYCINRQKEFSAILGVLLVMQLLCMPIHAKISKKYGKTAPIKFGLIIWSAALIASLFLRIDSPRFLIYVIAGICGIGTSAATFVPWSILPEISDVDELMTGKRREGIYSGIVTFIRKAANGIVIGLLGVLLQLIGYTQPKFIGDVAVQSSLTVMGIRLLFGLLPVLFILLALYFSSKYKLTQEKHLIMMQEVTRMNEGENFNQDSQAIEICEEVTGMAYSQLISLRHAFKQIEGNQSYEKTM